MDNEILNYKDLAALPKVKSIYEVQRPDLISYEPHPRYTSDEMLERCGYGEVWYLGPPSEAVGGEEGPGVSGPLCQRHLGLYTVVAQTLVNWNLQPYVKIKQPHLSLTFLEKIRAGDTIPVFLPCGDVPLIPHLAQWPCRFLMPVISFSVFFTWT